MQKLNKNTPKLVKNGPLFTTFWAYLSQSRLPRACPLLATGYWAKGCVEIYMINNGVFG